MNPNARLLCSLALAFGGLGWNTAAIAEEFNAEELAFFENKIRPVLVENCYKCHSADSKKLKADLLLDRRSGHLEGGDIGPAIDLAAPAESLLLETLQYETEDLEMPPAGKLDDAIIADFAQWIEMGAPWPKEVAKDASGVKDSFDLAARQAAHWCWQPIADPGAPEVSQEDWPLADLDRFILRELDEKGWLPADDADPLTWLRRVSFDLTGLPPTLEEIAAFEADPNYAATVDRLLASPHFGERWARHWMDLARYAETSGHEFDYPIQHAYRYRDYLIEAFNQDLPYDQFLTEQLAGDLLPNPRLDPETQTNASIVGTGFWFFHEAVHAPTDVRGDEADRIDNQIDVFGKSFLGLTIACARCHDHKFDAIGTADYYAIAGYLQSSRRQTALLDPHGQIAADVSKARQLQESAQQSFRKQGLFDLSKGKPSDYLASLTTLHQRLDESPELARKIVFEDFENGAPAWIREGKAFDDGPVPGTRPGQRNVSGFLGEKAINSFNGGDAATGTLTSPEFVIELPEISFLVGGGNHKDKTCATLLIDGKVVRSTTGDADEALNPAYWNVSEFIGKTAKIQLVDQAKGGWGHVNFDHVVFNGSVIPPSIFEEVAVLQGLDPIILERWFSLEKDRRLPFRPEVAESGGEVYADFNDGLPDGWTVSGEAFSPEPTTQVTWTPNQLLPSGVHSSSEALPAARGVLRSPTFELKHEHIYIRARASGKGPKIRLVIDEYLMHEFSGLLFGGTILKTEKLVSKDSNWAWYRLMADPDKYFGHRAYLEISDEGNGALSIDEIRFVDGPLTMRPKQVIPSEQFDTFAADPSASEDAIAYANFLQQHKLLPRIDPLTQVSKKLASIELAEPIPVIALTDGSPENEHIHIRGSHQSLGEVVPRRNLIALGGQVAEDALGSGRLALAQQITAEDNPLVRRVIVNRLWHHLFGRGLVPTVDDFGVMGQPPSHPALLDHLASEFSDAHEWSVKSMLRTLVLSRTYRMSSAVNPANDRSELAALDPDNTLLSHAPVRRLQAEAIRDAILTVSDGLNRELHGRSVPIYLTSFMSGRGRPKKVGPLDGEGRRSLYLETRRNFLNPFMLTFDQPSPFNAIGRRTVSNVPAQALTLMNDPFIEEQARRWGERVATVSATPEEKIARVFRAAFARDPSAEEVTLAAGFLGDQPDPTAWEDLCHALFNKKEFIFLN